MLLMQSVGNYSCSGSNCQLMAFTLDVGVCVCVCVCVGVTNYLYFLFVSLLIRPIGRGGQRVSVQWRLITCKFCR